MPEDTGAGGGDSFLTELRWPAASSSAAAAASVCGVVFALASFFSCASSHRRAAAGLAALNIFWKPRARSPAASPPTHSSGGAQRAWLFGWQKLAFAVSAPRSRSPIITISPYIAATYTRGAQHTHAHNSRLIAVDGR